jgi:5'(3')-deoxyribonucleotidase
MKTNENFDGIITFGIDCDEVLRSLLNGMVSLYNEKFGENMTRDEVRDFNVEVSFPKITEMTGKTSAEWFFQEHGQELFLKSPALPGINQAIQKLRKYGQVIIITYQKTYQNKLDTLNWLINNKVEVDGLCFLKNKTLLHVDYLLDDNWWNFLGSNADTGVLITAPYNEDIAVDELIEKSNCKKMYRFSSLEEFADWYIKEHEHILWKKK